MRGSALLCGSFLGLLPPQFRLKPGRQFLLQECQTLPSCLAQGLEDLDFPKNTVVDFDATDGTRTETSPCGRFFVPMRITPAPLNWKSLPKTRWTSTSGTSLLLYSHVTDSTCFLQT